MAKVELLIWWTSQAECAQLGPEAPRALPAYVKVQYALRAACATPPHGRLWVSEQFGAQALGPWPSTLIADIARDSGGIVFSKRDLHLFTWHLPGIVTDFQVRMLVVTT